LLIEEYPKNLEMAAQQHYIGSYLEVGSKELLIERAKLLKGDIKRKKKNKPLKWRFSISREQPLIFVKNEVDGYKLQADISCEIEGIGDDIKKQNVLLRVWSWDERISYREGVDDCNLKAELELLGWKRVILRFHFDRKDPNAMIPGPLYHLQVGGNPKEDENCWLPKQINIPRIPYNPIDLILLCEFVLVNFFPRESEKLRKEPEWNSLVRKSQELFMKPYLDIYTKCFNNKTNTLLGALVSILNET